MLFFVVFLMQFRNLNPEMAEQILNEAVSDEILSAGFPLLQLSVKIDELGVERLKAVA